MIHRILENGIEAYVKNDDNTQSYCLQTWVGVGSMDELPAERGMAHFVEHMLFKGTSKLKVGEFASIIEARGGSVNAYTSFDNTVYYLNMMASSYQKGIEILSDCLFNSAFDPKEFDREKEVILEEIRRGLDDPNASMSRQSFALTYHGTEVGRPIIGYFDEVAKFTRDDLYAFYKKWYQPQNMRVVFVGAVDETQAWESIRKNYAPYKKAVSMPDRIPFILDKYPKEKVALLKGDYNQSKFHIMFRTPRLECKDSVALDVGLYCIGAGETGRFTTSLKDEQKIVSSAGAAQYSPVFGGVAFFSASCDEDRYLDAIEAVLKEIYATCFGDKPLSESELEKAKANFLIDKYYKVESLEGKADSLVQSLKTSYKDKFDDIYFSIVETLTLDDIQEAFTKYIKFENSMFSGLLAESSKLDEAAIGQRIQKFCDSIDPHAVRFQVAPAAASKTRAHNVQFKSSGHDFFLEPNYDNKLFQLYMVNFGGQRFETEETAGVFSFLGDLIGIETKSQSYDKVLELIESKAASLEGVAGKDTFGFKLTCLDRDRDEFLALLCDIVMNPSIPEIKLENAKRGAAQIHKSRKDSPAYQCMKGFSRLMFPNHPYSMDAIGEEKNYSRFTQDYLLSHYERAIHQNQWMFSVCSSESAEDLENYLLHSPLKDLFPALKSQHGSYENIVQDTFSSYKPQSRYQAFDKEQSHLMIGFPGTTWRDLEDRVTLNVISQLFGGQGGRLFLELRDKHSLAYSVAPIMYVGLDGGYLGAYIATADGKQGESRQRLIDEFKKICDSKVSGEELDRTKKYIIGNHDLDMQKASSRIMSQGLMSLYGLGMDYYRRYPDLVESISAEDIMRVSQKYFKEDAMSTMLVGRADF